MMREGLVLVVDDDPLIREVLRRTLEGHGYEVVLAESVKEAWSSLSWDDFDLVLTDLQMPEESGMTLLRDIKHRLPQLPVVMITGYGTMDVVIDALRNGANDFLVKPHKPRELLDIVKREIAHYRQAQPEYGAGAPRLQFEAMEADEIDGLLANLRAVIDARCALLVETGGAVVAAKGATSDLNFAALGALVAENTVVTSMLAVGKENPFRLHFHEGEQYSIFSEQVVPGVSLLIIFEQGVRLGAVLHYTKVTVPKLALILASAEARLLKNSPGAETQLSNDEPSSTDIDDQLLELFSFEEILNSGTLDEDVLDSLEMQFSDLWGSE